MKNKAGTFCIVGGLLLLAAALFLGSYNIWSDMRAAKNVSIVLEQLDEVIPVNPPEPEMEEILPDYVLNPEMEMPVVTVDGFDYIGLLEIPALELSLPIMAEWDEFQSKIAPCRYQGSVYQDNMIIAGHNYRSHFARLQQLAQGDEVLFTDGAGNLFRFTVSQLETIQGTDFEGMERGDWDLTLFTCTLGGKYRVTVRCDRQTDSN